MNYISYSVLKSKPITVKGTVEPRYFEQVPVISTLYSFPLVWYTNIVHLKDLPLYLEAPLFHLFSLPLGPWLRNNGVSLYYLHHGMGMKFGKSILLGAQSRL